MVRATQVASWLGRGFAVLFGVWAVLSLNPFLVVIAFFIFMGAQGEAQQVRMKMTLERVPVADLMTPRRVGVDAGASLEQALWDLRRARLLLLPVTEDERPVGQVSLETVRAVPDSERMTRTVREVMVPAVVVRLDEDGWTALRRMAEEERPQLVVVEADGVLAGTLDVNDVQRGMALYQAREERSGQQDRRWRQERPA